MLLSRAALLFLCLTPAFAQRVITTVAGTDWLFPGDGRPALNAPLSGGTGLDVATDRAGNYYIADGENLVVMRVGPDGIVNVVAGNGFSFTSGDGGLAVNAGVFLPTAVAVDPTSGNIYIAEYGSRIRRVTPDGIITTYAGTGDDGFAGDNGAATKALLNAPYGLAVDFLGNLYIADSGNNRIRKVTPAGVITTVAGNGQKGTSGDSARATSIPLNSPTRLAVDSAGNLYIVEGSSPDFSQTARIRKLDATGAIKTIAGGGFDQGENVPATTAALLAVAVAVDSAGTVYVVDVFSQGIRTVDAQGKIHTLAGGKGINGFSGDGGPALDATFNFQLYPALAIDSANNVLVSDQVNYRIRKITQDRKIQTIAGNGLFHFSGNGGPATSATLDIPTGIVGDAAGNLYITEQVLGRIRRIAPDGTISVYAGGGGQGFAGDGGPATSASLSYPMYMTWGPDGSLFFSDSANCAIRYINPSGIIKTYAGSTRCDYGGDGGAPLQASLSGPGGVAFDDAGELIIADTYNNRIRVVLTNGNIYTLAGDGSPAFSGENVKSLAAQVYHPVGLRVHDTGIYFSDSGNHRIRRIDIDSLNITTVAGNGQKGFAGDGGKATAASLNAPQGIDFDAAGNLYIADTLNSVIRKVDTAGNISTFAGSITGNSGDGGLATNAELEGPADVFVDPQGNLFLTDEVLNRVRAVLVNPPAFQASPLNLAFTAPAGSASVDQRVDLAGSIPGMPFSTSVTASGWLQASPSNGSMPAAVQVTVDASKLAAGSYQGTITITAPTAQPPTQIIHVALTATAPGDPSLNVRPSLLTFSYVQQTAARSRSVTVSNLGGGSLAFTATAATVSGASWLRVTPASGNLGAFASTPASITADPSGLIPGTYSGTVTFSSANPPQSFIIPVTMTVTAVAQTILIPQSGLTFFAVQGGGPPPPQFFNILNSGTGQMPFTTSASTIFGGGWLSVFPANGTSDAASPIVPQVRVDINPSGLASGIYYGTATVTAPSADNNPQFVSIILNVLPPNSKIGPITQPSGIIFAAAAGGEAPGSQTVVVQSTSRDPITFVTGTITVDGAKWLTALPAGGTITPTQPARIVIQPHADGLAPGVYRGALTLSFSDGSTRSVAVVLVVISSGATALATAPRPLATSSSGCTPQQLVPVFTQLSSGFSIPAGFPGQVSVKVIDDCANAMTTGNVIVNFSNGDAPLRLTSLKDGNWAATWTPQHTVASITVTADASIPEQNLKGKIQITGGLNDTDPTPVLTPGGIVNSATFAAENTLSPGSFVSVFGSKLAATSTVATSVPLMTNLGGTGLVIAGREAPVYFTRDDIVSAVIPYGIPVNTVHQVIVSRGNSISVPLPVTIAPAAPGIFSYDGSGKGQGIIIGIDPSTGAQTYANAANPAHAGQAIIIYCTGLGEVSPGVPAGTPTPGIGLSITVNQATVTIGGVPAKVLFAGLTPTATALYQVNVEVPTGVAPGNSVPVVITVAGQQSPPATIAVR